MEIGSVAKLEHTGARAPATIGANCTIVNQEANNLQKSNIVV